LWLVWTDGFWWRTNLWLETVVMEHRDSHP